MSEYLSLAAWMLFLARLSGLAGVAAGLAEAFARIGMSPAALLLARPRGPLAATGLGYLLGFATLGTAYLGLGLTGLFFPFLVVATPVALIAASRAGWKPGLLLVRAAREAGGLPLVGKLMLLAAVLPAVPVLCGPEFEVDCEVYHLAWPWQMLLVHRAPLDHTVFAFHIPLLFDGVNALPLVFGDDRPAKWLSALSFVAASAFCAGRALRRGRPAAAWVGPLLAYTAGTVAWMCTSAKDDLPSSACFVAGALLWLEGAWMPAAACMGIALAGKYVYGVYAVLWVVFLPPPRRRWIPVAAALAIPVIPWAVKAFLATGNPVFPFAAALFPTFDWGPENDRTFLNPVRALWFPGSATWAGIPAAWTALMRSEYLPVLLGLPLLLAAARDSTPGSRQAVSVRRRAAAALALGTVIALGAGHLSRYLIPAVWLLSCLIAEEAAGLPGWWRRAAVAVLAAYALGRIAVRPQFWIVFRDDAFRPLAKVFKARLSTRLEIVEVLNRLTPPGGPPLRLLSNGDTRSYRFPCRIVYGGALGETPLIWRIVRASRDQGEIGKRFRQLGTDYLLHNFISAEWLNDRYSSFPWDARMIRLYVGFCLGRLVIESPPERSDYANGGFYVFRILRRPLPRPQPWLFYLPGAEMLYGPVTVLENMNRLDDALAESKRLLMLMPEVGHAWNTVGHLLTAKADTRGGYEVLRRFAELGMIDGMNIGEYGANAARVRQYGTASRMLAQSMRRQPDHRNVVLVNEAFLWVAMAVEELTARRLDHAGLLADQAAWALAQISRGGTLTPMQERAKRETTAFVWAVRGELARVRGRAAEAAACFRTAWQTAPDVSLAPRWKELADALTPRFGAL